MSELRQLAERFMADVADLSDDGINSAKSKGAEKLLSDFEHTVLAWAKEEMLSIIGEDWQVVKEGKPLSKNDKMYVSEFNSCKQELRERTIERLG